MTLHAEYSLCSSSVAEILNLLLAIPTFEAISTESLVSSQDRQILDFVATAAAAICTIVANQRPVSK